MFKHETDTLGLDRYGDILAQGYGLYSRTAPEEPGEGVIIKGAVINNVLYGDTTSVITSIKDLSIKLPVFFEFYQNYTNHFNPVTAINFQIKEKGLVQLYVYDIIGKGVAILVDEVKSEGIYSVIFDAGNLPSGVYIYSMKVNEFFQIKKMLLMK